MNNNKKSFIGGILLGLSIALVIVFGINQFNSIVSGRTLLSAGGVDKTEYLKKLLNTYYMGDIDSSAMKEGSYKGMVAALKDPYTVYFDTKEYSDFKRESDGTFSGIGISVMENKEDNTILVTSVFANSPSEEMGMLPGDKIIKVNGKDVIGSLLDEAVEIIRGKEGTNVDITIYRETENKVIDLTLTRRKVEVPTVAYEMLEDSIGYIQIASFDGVTYDQFKTAYNTLNEAGQKGLIIDLRYNGGGSLAIVEKIADMLLPQGPIVYIEYKGKEKEPSAISDANRIEVPLVILVNGYSASASEVLTGAVKDYNIGKIVGTTTFGKGIVQSVIEISDGSALKLTTAKYYTPSGVCIHEIGIVPDYVVELPKELQLKIKLTKEEDIQLQKAMDVILDEID